MEAEGRNVYTNSNSVLKLDKNNNLQVSLSTAKYQNAVLDGNVYFATNQIARTWSVALATTHTGLVVSNPVTSGKNLVILKVGFTLSVAPVAIATIGLFTGYSTAGIVTHTTPLTPQNCLIGNGSGLATADEAATLVGTPLWTMPILGGFTAGALPSTSPSILDVDGAIVVKPGGYIGIGALTAVFGFGSITWQEVNI